ncbi:hypothetical protein [Nocardioides zeicaulis]|uniref:Uncharacterized protein n=1 Tax=Nocardioides zeicaulis TaxID=1776857 RepID=A0ABV6E6Q5_9ACTN
MTRARLLLAVALLLPVALTGCGRDPQDVYCDAVREHQGDLSDVAASEDPGAVLGALDAYDDLADKAPRDVADDWVAVVGPLHRLRDAVADAGVDPATYAADDPPPGLAGEDRAAIEAAAREVGAERTVTAMASVEQHALDVCGTPLAR